MIAVPDAALDAFWGAEQQTWKDAAPVETQGRAVEVHRAATRAGLAAAAPLLAAEAVELAAEEARWHPITKCCPGRRGGCRQDVMPREQCRTSRTANPSPWAAGRNQAKGN